MIHAQYGTNVTSYLSLLESKIHTAVADAKLRWLFKFTNDMTKTVKYCYGKKDTVTISKDKIVFETDPKEEILKSYEQNTSKILTPKTSLITETSIPTLKW